MGEVTEGGLFQVIKKKKTLKGSSGWVPLFAGAYAAFSGGGALNGSSGVVVVGGSGG